jgi:DNA helicase-2/ATP-dependent DNA helicase PcrA
LERFLEEVSLVSDTDDWEEDENRVTLMTLHASKGLEFPVVFIIGVEQNLLPHERNMDDPDHVEEERRLLFVGMTRAREELELNYSTTREFAGSRRYNAPSMFLMELPRSDLEYVGVRSTSLAIERPAPGRPTPDIPSIGGGIRLTTAAAMAGDTPSEFTPDAFSQGSFVLHESHGLGRVVALDDSGEARRALVRFGNGAASAEKTVLIESLIPFGS